MVAIYFGNSYNIRKFGENCDKNNRDKDPGLNNSLNNGGHLFRKFVNY